MTNLLLAAVLVLEAAGEGKQGMEAVNEVAFNRACLILNKHPHLSYNAALWGVLTKPKQFSCLNDLTPQEAISKAQKDSRSFTLALKIASARMTNHTGGATHYHARYIKRPSWSLKLKHTTTIGQHMFYK